MQASIREAGASMQFRIFTHRAVLLLIALSAVVFTPQSVSANIPRSDPVPLDIVLTTPLTRVYEGDIVILFYLVDQRGDRDIAELAPLTPGKASITARMGTASVVAKGMSGMITYTARQAGSEVLTLIVDLDSGSGTTSIDFTVYPKGNYSLLFMLVNEQDEQGSGFREVIHGKGNFTNLPGQPLQGTGRTDVWFLMWASTSAFNCIMDPPVTGSTFFDIYGAWGAVGRRGSPFTLEFFFDPISTNGSSITCHGLGDMLANFPFPSVSEGDLNVLDLTNMKFPPGGGSLRINRPKLWGTIYAIRRQP